MQTAFTQEQQQGLFHVPVKSKQYWHIETKSEWEGIFDLYNFLYM